MRQVAPLLLLLAIGCGSLDGSDTKEAVAFVKAEQLQKCAQSHLAKHEGEKVESLDALADYADDGEQALLDPWGQPFHFRYVVDPETRLEQLVIWTVEPKTGHVIAAPPRLASQVSTAD